MTSLPDWLVERAALDEVPAASRDRIDRADPGELAERVAALRDANARELAAYPAGPAVALLESRIASERRRRIARRRRRWLGWLGIATTAAVAVLVVTRVTPDTTGPSAPGIASGGTERVKGLPRLLVFRQIGDQVERLDQDAIVRDGDLLQLSYDAGEQTHGVIASIDGAGVVTLHFPASEDAPREATAIAPRPTALPHAYALDDAPRFERFFFITAKEPIDLQQSLAALRSFAHRVDSATASVDLPAGLRQWSLRLRKPNRPSSTP